MKLYITPSHIRDKFHIVAAGSKRVICTMNWQDLKMAERMVRRENGLLHSMFGPRRDNIQKAYDRWLWETKK